MRRLLIFVLTGALALLVAVPAGAEQRSKPGADVDRQGGSCEFHTSVHNAIVACAIYLTHRVHYRFHLPADARHVEVKVHRRTISGCCGTVRTRFRRDDNGRTLVVGVKFHNYGNPLGGSTLRIRRVEVHFRGAARTAHTGVVSRNTQAS